VVNQNKTIGQQGIQIDLQQELLSRLDNHLQTQKKLNDDQDRKLAAHENLITQQNNTTGQHDTKLRLQREELTNISLQMHALNDQQQRRLEDQQTRVPTLEDGLAALESRQTRGEKQAADNLSTMDTALNQRLGLLYANVTSEVTSRVDDLSADVKAHRE
jgi:hypothetical protein